MTKLKHIELNLWLWCNHKCIFCMSWAARWRVLLLEKYEVLKWEIEELSLKWYNSIWFLWWEPTIHTRFLDLIILAKGKWFKNIEVISNWSKFCDNKFLKQSVSNWLTRISISIHSINREEEAVLTGGIKNVLNEKVDAIKNIIRYNKEGFLKQEISVNIVVSKVNYKNIKKLILVLYKLWVRSFRLNFIQLEWYSVDNYDILALKYEDFKNYLISIISLHKKYTDIRINFEAIPWCYSWLNYEDFLKYSEQDIDREKDKISRDDIDLVSRDIMNQLDRRKELKVYLKKCDNCFLKWTCEWIWKRYVDYFKIK